MIPFAQECAKERETLVQEDNAGAHASHYQQEVFNLAGVTRLLWPANSPDLNMIEPCWFWMKRETTKSGPLHSTEKLQVEWHKCWNSLSQERIQMWIERVERHVKEVVKLDGGNEYQEGRLKGEEKKRIH